MTLDIGRVTELVREVAETEVLPRFRSLAEDDITEKRPGDLVTVADIEAERRLSAGLLDILPGSVVIGEEAAEADAGLVERLAEPGRFWVVDPVDGTANFAKGSPHFAVMVALIVEGETCAAWILDPVGHRMAVAETGAGAWLHEASGEASRLAVARPPEELPRMRGALSLKYLPMEVRQAIRARAGGTFDSKLYTLGCAGQEYLRLARGETHFSFYQRNMPWDHAPGALIHREAGGHAARLDGRPYRPAELQGGLLLAPDEASWQFVREAVFGAHL